MTVHLARALPIFLLWTSLTPALARAAEPPPAPPCASPAHHQFDFWIGDWEVRNPAGKVVGQNHITALHGGCVLFESWTGAGGFAGSSLNIYDAGRGKWHQTWVDGAGGLLLLEGGYADGRMVLVGEAAVAAKPADTATSRITWQPLPDGRVRQHWEVSQDKGATWTTAFDGYYQKK